MGNLLEGPKDQDLWTREQEEFGSLCIKGGTEYEPIYKKVRAEDNAVYTLNATVPLYFVARPRGTIDSFVRIRLTIGTRVLVDQTLRENPQNGYIIFPLNHASLCDDFSLESGAVIEIYIQMKYAGEKSTFSGNLKLQ